MNHTKFILHLGLCAQKGSNRFIDSKSVQSAQQISGVSASPSFGKTWSNATFVATYGLF